ncbi:unnamed protein product [Tilletia controversa]|nr:unnamed protein product [Tilletia controversa]CAD6903572.1 unnamed protein product [Tilletia controversa]CAD6942965.1 unnamed protein product [Tilletia controversa]
MHQPQDNNKNKNSAEVSDFKVKQEEEGDSTNMTLYEQCDEEDYDEDYDDDYRPDNSNEQYAQDLEDDEIGTNPQLLRLNRDAVREELAGLRQDLKDDTILEMARAALAQPMITKKEEDETADDAVLHQSDSEALETELEGLRLNSAKTEEHVGGDDDVEMS